MKQKTTETQSKKPAVKPLTTLAELSKACSAFRILPITVGATPDPTNGGYIDGTGTAFEIKLRTLRPEEDAVLDDIVNTVFPPIIRGRSPEDDRVNHADLDYVKKKTLAVVTARALGLYWCVPMFSDMEQGGVPNLKEHDAIRGHVQCQANEEVLQTLWNAIRNGGVRVGEMVSFFS